MAKTRPPYTPEFRRQMVELVGAGRSPEELAREFEPTAQSIKNWVGQAERDAGRGDGDLTTPEREELNRLRRENRQLRLEVLEPNFGRTEKGRLDAFRTHRATIERAASAKFDTQGWEDDRITILIRATDL